VPTLPDQLLRGLAADAPFRVAVARTTGLVREAISRHEVRGAVAEAFARGMTALALTAVMDKDVYRLSAQWLGRGPIGTLNVDMRAAGTLRAFSTGARDEAELRAGLGHGLFSLLRQKEGGQFSQGQVALGTQEVDGDLEWYLEKSDQVPTVLRVLTSQWDGDVPGDVVGVMVQALPGATRAELAEVVSPELLDRSLGSGSLRELAARAAPGVTSIDWFAEQELSWACGCSLERVLAGVRMLGPAEIADMLTVGEEPEVRCDYCTTVHVVGTDELLELLASFADDTSN
jgi:molecular chaperone Hsp33